jgi:hypothetical protein
MADSTLVALDRTAAVMAHCTICSWDVLSEVSNLLEVAALGAISATEIEDECVKFRVAF